MVKKPLTRVEEIRTKRGLKKAELARLAGMPPQTLQRIEDGSTKSLSASARKLLAFPLRVREDQLLMPVGWPIDPIAGEEAPASDLIFNICREMLAEMREIKAILVQIREQGEGRT